MNIKTKLTNLYNTIVSKVGDKKLHLICSFLITFLFGLINIILGVLIGCLCAVGKEAYDEYQYKVNTEGQGWDWDDIKYDAIGIVAALIILLIL